MADKTIQTKILAPHPAILLCPKPTIQNCFLMEKKLPYLQISRAIAALIVVVHHVSGAGTFYLNFNPLGGVFMVGWNGVDFFFVLSGFIIYYIHSKDLGKRAEWKRY